MDFNLRADSYISYETSVSYKKEHLNTKRIWKKRTSELKFWINSTSWKIHYITLTFQISPQTDQRKLHHCQTMPDRLLIGDDCWRPGELRCWHGELRRQLGFWIDPPAVCEDWLDERLKAGGQVRGHMKGSILPMQCAYSQVEREMECATETWQQSGQVS